MMRYFNVAILGLSLFTLTCILCGVTGVLLQLSPLLGFAFLIFGALGVVLTVDILQATLFG
ncbi:hypothetical protein OsccyDRAFT_1439 [Leptolyngbyaceae cyanobacterium JSC-12]|nr:hypothetical protein OsccyDRAFT_1439 [Leptolyngbyaceae cyanobacterium JSC-12]